jgi:hypothetical protein
MYNPLDRQSMHSTFRFRGKGSLKENLPAFGERVDASFLAALTGMTRQHVTRLCRAGKVPGAYQSKGGHWRCRWSAMLARWVNENLSHKGAVGAAHGGWTKRAQRLDDEILACAEVIKFAQSRLRVLRRQMSLCPADAQGQAALRNAERFLLSSAGHF